MPERRVKVWDDETHECRLVTQNNRGAEPPAAGVEPGVVLGDKPPEQPKPAVKPKRTPRESGIERSQPKGDRE